MSALDHIWVGLMPPSSNQIYINNPGGKGRVLSPKARSFKLKAMQTVQRNGRVGLLNLQQNVPYELKLVIFFEQVELKTSKNDDRYKKIDLSNRIKLIEDTVADAVGLDDRHNFRVVVEKHCDPDHPGLYVSLRAIDEREVGLTKENYDKQRLRRPERNGAGRASATSRFLTGSSRNRSG